MSSDNERITRQDAIKLIKKVPINGWDLVDEDTIEDLLRSLRILCPDGFDFIVYGSSEDD